MTPGESGSKRDSEDRALVPMGGRWIVRRWCSADANTNLSCLRISFLTAWERLKRLLLVYCVHHLLISLCYYKTGSLLTNDGPSTPPTRKQLRPSLSMRYLVDFQHHLVQRL